jgi:monoterpene epsilon-lactone hydrolase
VDFQWRHCAGTGEAVEIAAKIGIRVISIDYRRAPDHPAPAAMDDVVAAWREIIMAKDPGRIALGGTSAGGNLFGAPESNQRYRELGSFLVKRLR